MINVTEAALLSLKLMVLIGIAVYALFAAIIVRQEQLMANVLEENFEPILKIASVLHLGAAIALFIFALIIL